MKMSPAINELAAALAKAQGKMQPAIKDKKNPHFKSSYADLASIREAYNQALSENGLALIQTVETRDNRDMVLVTMLAHCSGQWVSGDMPIIVQKMDPQGIGSALTYYRRQGAAAITGIAPADDDAEGAMKRGPLPKPVELKPETVTLQEAEELCELLEKCDAKYKHDVSRLCKVDKVSPTFEDLPLSQYARYRNGLLNHISKRNEASKHMVEKAQ